MVRPSLLKPGHQRDSGGHGDFGGAVALRIGGGGNEFAGEGERGRSGRGERFVAEGHAHFAGFRGDGGIDGSGEMKNQVRRIVRGDGGGEVGSDATDKKTAGLLVQSCGTSEETGQKGIEGGERDEAASVFKDEFCGEIGVASLDAGAGFVGGKFSENVVVVQTPAWAIGLWR